MRPLFNYMLLKNSSFGLPICSNLLMNYKRTASFAILPFQSKTKLSSNSIDTLKWNSANIYTRTAPIAPVASTGTEVAKDESKEFMDVFPDIVRDLTSAGRHPDIPDANNWYAKVLEYTVPGGKKNRGLTVVTAYRVFCPPAELTPANIRLAHVLGWCVEMLQAFLLILDDIIDGAEMRRGYPCWYQLHENKNIAINDGVLVENGIYVILKKYFRDKPYYLDILEACQDAIFKTSMGQLSEILMCRTFQETRKFDTFTIDRYNTITKYKTSYYSFHLPVALSMYMAGINDPEVHRQVKYILLEMGHYYQIQDDYLDCFGDADEIGKLGFNDIKEGKCSWPIVVALQRATAQQKQTLEKCYQSADPENMQTVKKIHQEIGLPSIFATYEEQVHKSIVDHIQQLPRGIPEEIFFKMLDKIHARSI
ncbi:farnesyl pyrophosphate synthase-like [Planococcus citri]|uniref:farnesyl pyrophosphate synthase-like n=1 Tax=Planococcus citri TaxID=170843 RepID=UPI0031F85D90